MKYTTFNFHKVHRAAQQISSIGSQFPITTLLNQASPTKFLLQFPLQQDSISYS